MFPGFFFLINSDLFSKCLITFALHSSISGQIPLDPSTMEVISPVFSDQVEQVIKNIDEIAKESGKSLDDIVKITVYLKNLENFQAVNQAMEKFFTKPYPARAAVEISKLPKDVEIEMDAIVLAQ